METVMLKVTSAFFIGGRMARQGDVVEVPAADAKHLLNRGKAKLAEVAAVANQDAIEPEADARVALVEDEQPRRRRGKRGE